MALMESDRPPPVSRRWFSQEFKAVVVALVLGWDRPAAAVARRLGIGEGTPANWVRQAGVDRGERPVLTTGERTELDALRERPVSVNSGVAGSRDCLGQLSPCERARRSGSART